MGSEISNFRDAKAAHVDMARILATAERRECTGFYYDCCTAVEFRLIIRDGNYNKPQYTERLSRFLAIACAEQQTAIWQRALELSQAELDAQKQKAQDEAIAFLRQP